jgi:hypothetical protein
MSTIDCKPEKMNGWYDLGGGRQDSSGGGAFVLAAKTAIMRSGLAPCVRRFWGLVWSPQ